MTRTRFFLATLAAAGAVALSLPTGAQTAAGAPSSTSGTPGVPSAQTAPFGSSGQTVGTVTAPSVGSYNRPAVGVTNSAPSWRNTNPPAK